MEDKLLTPAGSYTDEPFQRAENSCLPQYPKLLYDVYKPILKNNTDSGLRMPPYWDSIFDGTGETRMPCMLDDDASHDGDFWLSDAVISYPGPYGEKRCDVCQSHVLPTKRKDIHYYLFYYKKGMRWYSSYTSNFAMTKSMLSNIVLVTGEAAPGYIPNPVIARRVHFGIYQSKGSIRICVRRTICKYYSQRHG